MAAYQALLKPENKKLYQATLDKKKIDSGDIDPEQPDPNVELGIALTDCVGVSLVRLVDRRDTEVAQPFHLLSIMD